MPLERSGLSAVVYALAQTAVHAEGMLAGQMKSNPGMQMLTIGRLAAKAGVGIDTIRFYERIGLLAAGENNTSGYRLYPEALVRTLRLIKCARRCGFSLAEITELMRCDPSRSSTPHQLAVSKKRELDETIAVMQAMSAALAALAADDDSRTAPGWETENPFVSAFLGAPDSIDRASGKPSECATALHSQKTEWTGSEATQTLPQATSRARR